MLNVPTHHPQCVLFFSNTKPVVKAQFYKIPQRWKTNKNADGADKGEFRTNKQPENQKTGKEQ